MKKIIVLVTLCLMSTFAFSAEVVINGKKVSSYDECILQFMGTANSDHGAEQIRKSCRSYFESKWESAGVRSVSTGRTRNNDNRSSHGCSLTSSDGKYCASAVTASAAVPVDDEYEYRFVKGSSCPFKVISGPKGWYKVLSCQVTNDGKNFNFKIKGWTKPQRFQVNMPMQKRKK